MIHKNCVGFLVSSIVLSAMLAQAQDVPSVTFPDLNNPAIQYVFTNNNDIGTTHMDGDVAIFSGELVSTNLVVESAPGAGGKELASVQVLAQVKLFEALPDAETVGPVQGAFAVLQDGVDSTSGVVYAWAKTNDAPSASGWLALQKKDVGGTFTVTNGSFYYITFVFHYTDPNTYQVFIGDGSVASPIGVTHVASVSVTNSAEYAVSGIQGMSLFGEGGLKQVSTTNAWVFPLSTQIGFSVYDTASGILMVIDTQNESGSAPINVYAWINGVKTLVGTVAANGTGHYEFYAIPGCGLVAGQTYKFEVIDEDGNTHTYDSGLTITGTKMDSVIFALDTMTVSFNTEVNHTYLVKVADSPAAPANEWTVQYVSQNVGGVWGDFTTTEFTAAAETTTIKIPISGSKSKAFFKVFKLD